MVEAISQPSVDHFPIKLRGGAKILGLKPLSFRSYGLCILASVKQWRIGGSYLGWMERVEDIKDLRRISLVSSPYKIISKILATRLEDISSVNSVG